MKRACRALVLGSVSLVGVPIATTSAASPESGSTAASTSSNPDEPSGSDAAMTAAREPGPDDTPAVGPTPPPRQPVPPPPRLPSVQAQSRSASGPGTAAAVPSPSSAHHLGLTRQPDGSFIYRDPGRRFSARILPDGRVRFADRWRRPTPPGDRRSDRGRCCGRPPEGVGRAVNPMQGIPAGGPTEWAIHRGPRQVHAEAKARFLRRTEAFRVQLAIADYRAHVDRQLSSLPAELSTLWATPTRSLADKRALLFSRWDECEDRLAPAQAEDIVAARPSIDALRLAAATAARRTIERFVRTHAPKGSAAAYTASELSRLNRGRASAEPFSPYRPRASRAPYRPSATQDPS